MLLTLGVGSVGLGGLFSVFSYITPTMTQVAGLPERLMPAVLAVFGVGMILGNLIGAKPGGSRPHADHRRGTGLEHRRHGSVHHSPRTPRGWPLVGNVLLIAQGVALVPALQIRLMDVAEDAADACGVAQPLGVQHRQRTQRLARGRGDSTRPGMDLHRLGWDPYWPSSACRSSSCRRPRPACFADPAGVSLAPNTRETVRGALERSRSRLKRPRSRPVTLGNRKP